jgi:DNA-directed RNA polymerase specialized sigma24 family protein
MQAVMTAYQSLSVNDQRIIQLRVVQGLSWHDVGQALCLMGEPQRSNPALRKRGQRALENLRRNYHKIRPAQESDST